MDKRTPWPFKPFPALVQKQEADSVCGADELGDEDIEQAETEVDAQEKTVTRRRKMKDVVPSDTVQQPAPAGVAAGEPVMPLVHNSKGVLEDGYPHVLAAYLSTSLQVSDLCGKQEVFISRLAAVEIIRVLGGSHEQL